MASTLYALGYLLVRPLPRDSFFSADLLPDVIVSASKCLCAQFPGDYAIDWCTVSDEVRTEKFDVFGIRPDDQPVAREWATRAFGKEFGWPSVFFSVGAARQARTALLGRELDIRLFGLALPAESLEQFLRETAPPDPVEGFAPVGETAHHMFARQRCGLEDGGKRLGFEPLNIEHGLVDHSWLCNQLDAHCAQVLGIRPNASGLIETYEEAQRCCAEISRDEVHAEPGPWLPVAVFEYEST